MMGSGLNSFFPVYTYMYVCITKWSEKCPSPFHQVEYSYHSPAADSQSNVRHPAELLSC